LVHDFRAEEDARVAQELAKRYQAGVEDASLVLKSDSNTETDGVSRRELKLPSKADVQLLGAAAASCIPSTSHSKKAAFIMTDELDEEDIRFAQEQRDAVRTALKCS
jgi:hypothetical protein